MGQNTQENTTVNNVLMYQWIAYFIACFFKSSSTYTWILQLEFYFLTHRYDKRFPITVTSFIDSFSPRCYNHHAISVQFVLWTFDFNRYHNTVRLLGYTYFFYRGDCVTVNYIRIQTLFSNLFFHDTNGEEKTRWSQWPTHKGPFELCP